MESAHLCGCRGRARDAPDATGALSAPDGSVGAVAAAGRADPATGAGGRPAYPLEVMLRIHCVQLFYNLSDPAMEDALGDSLAVQRFVGLTVRDPRPDETNFRATIAMLTMPSVIHPPRTASGASCQGNQWYFGLKAHIGVDAVTGLVHSVATKAANVADVTQVAAVLHGGETQVWGDAGYQGVARRPEHQGRAVDWQIALRPGQRRRLAPGSAAAAAEQHKAAVRAKVEHPFLYVKRHFGYAQARYRGLAKNHHRLCWLFGLANLLRAARAAPA